MAKVTVLMPVYNVAPYVKEAIDSVLRQTYRDFELLVIDDCSTDNTIEVVRSISDPRIRIECNDHNLGLAENLNRGLSLIDTEYVARMDGDDIAHQDWLQKVVGYLDAHPNVGVCGACGTRFGTSQSEIVLPEDHEARKIALIYNCCILVPAFRHSLYSQQGLQYRTEAFPAEDYRFWADCSLKTRLHNIPESLFRYRMHQSQICTSRKEEQRHKADEVRQYMLHRMGDALTQNDIDYFCNHFLVDRNGGKEAYRDRRNFAKRLMTANIVEKYYDPALLKESLSATIKAMLIEIIIDNCFSNGYNIKAYMRYLASGMALHTGAKNELRFLVKSLIHRDK